MLDRVHALATSLKAFNDSLRLAKYNIAKQNGLNTSEFEVLVSLNNSPEPLSIKQLSAELLLCSQAITKICKHLQQLELIDSKKAEHDRRVTCVALTSKGRMVAEQEADYRRSVLMKAMPNAQLADVEQIAQAFSSLNSSANQLAREI